MEITTVQQSVLYLAINLVYAIMALLVGVIAIRAIEQAPLKRRRAEIGDKNVHGELGFWSNGVLALEFIAPLLQYSSTPLRFTAAICRARTGHRADAG